MTEPLVARIAAVLLWVGAAGLGLSCLACIRSLAAGRGIAVVLGYPTFGGGPFERHGIPTSIPLVSAFLAVCLLDGLAGVLLWQGRVAGAILAVALLPAGAVFWWGFALPYPPALAAVRTVLIALAWRSLR